MEALLDFLIQNLITVLVIVFAILFFNYIGKITVFVNKKINKNVSIGKFLSLTIGLCGFVFLVALIVQGDDSIEANAMQGNFGLVSGMINLALLVLLLVTIATLSFSLKGIFSDKSKLKKFGLSIGSFLFIIVIAFVFSSGVETPIGDGKVLSVTGSKLVETGINTFFFLVLIAGGLMLFNSISKLFKK